MGDGILTALMIMESLIHSQNWCLTTFSRLPQITKNIPIAVKKDLQEPSIHALIEQYATQLPSGRVVVRYSGTENVLRIMVEDGDAIQAEKVLTELSYALEITLR
jgi:phosphoglucosamine mutase